MGVAAHRSSRGSGLAALAALINSAGCADSLVGSVTRLVTEDTSSDTITFEDEAFPLGTEQARESLSGRWEGGLRGDDSWGRPGG